MGKELERRLPVRARGGVRAATVTALLFIAAVTALLPAGAGAANGTGARIYWGNEDADAIRFANVDGSGRATLFGGEGGGPCAVALHPAAGKVYWTNFHSGEIRAANLDGSGTASSLFTDAGSVCGIALDRAAGKIYWANYSANSIRVANLDGTGVPAIHAGAGDQVLEADRASADPVARLEHRHRGAGARQLVGGGEAGQARADDHDALARRRALREGEPLAQEHARRCGERAADHVAAIDRFTKTAVQSRVKRAHGWRVYREPDGANYVLPLAMETLWQDLRYAFRTLVKSRAFTAVAVCSLALGIGANVTIFSFVDALLLRPPSVHDPAGLLEVWQHNAARGNGIGSHMQLSFPDYEYYRDHNRVFSEMGGFTAETARVTWSRGGQGEILQGALVSANFFSMLGVRPALGRGFLPQDDQSSGAPPVVVLSHALWQQRLGADPALVGTPLTLNGRAFTVIGVGPPGFTGVLAGFAPDFWAPLSHHAALNPGLDFGERRQHWLLGVGRLEPGIAPAQARADLAVLGGRLAADYPDADRNLTAAAVPLELVPSPFRGFLAGVSGVLMAMVGLVLLIACANVANLLLARASSRRREMAVRAALGADRRRLIQQTLTEGLVIALLAGTAGLLLSLWATPMLWSLRPASLPLALNVSPDLRVLLFTLIASLLTGVAFGIVPALQQSRVHHVASLKDGSLQGGSSRSRLRHGLVVAQVTACLVLLIATGLCLRSLRNAGSIDPGFDSRDAVSASLNVAAFGYDEHRGRAYYAALLERVGALPGVRAASLADHLPLSSVTRMEPVEIDGTPEIPMDVALVAPGYFEAMGTPLLRGRDFSRQDDQSAPRVVVINQQMADRFWPGRDPIGQFVTLHGPDRSRTRARIIGVARTGKYQSLGEDPKPFFFRSLLQDYQPGVQLVVRAQGSVPIVPALAEVVRTLDPAMALVGVETLEEHLQVPMFPARAAGLLLGMFGAVALTLAIVGLYGVVAYSVSQRTVEIGVRMALGARPGDIVRMVVWQGVRLTLIGMGIGLALALGVTRVLSSVLYGISASDPITFGGVAAALAAVALLASYVPARWAARVEPIRALRAD